MKTMVRLVVLTVLCAGMAAAQRGAAPVEEQKAEIFAGYSLLNQHYYNPGDNRENLNGWNAAVSYFLTDHIGITADASGHYGSTSTKRDIQTYYGLLGPTVRFGSNKVNPFAHVLFGAVHPTGLRKNFAMAAGGGLDIKGGPNWSVRVVQGDYLMTRIHDDSQANFRISTGLVWHW